MSGAAQLTKILVIDNFDSFVHTIVDYLRQLGAAVTVVRNDAVPGDLTGYAGVLISPGPGAPADAGGSIAAIHRCADKGLPMLGVCLGHQALGEAFGARVGHAPELRHGKTSKVEHDGRGVFAHLPSPFEATRYHSLVVERERVPDELEVSAWTGPRETGVIMGVRHRRLPLEGVQFHPESILTHGGHVLLATWLAECGLPDALERAAGRTP